MSITHGFKTTLLSIAILSCASISASTKVIQTDDIQDNNKIIAGVSVGYGNTDWSYLVADKTSLAHISAPISATSGGVAGGAFILYKFNPSLRVKFSYTKFTNSQLGFLNPVPYNSNLKSVTTSTETYALQAYLTHYFLKSYYVFSGAGIGVTHKEDVNTTYDNGGPGSWKPYIKQNRAVVGGAFSLGVGTDIKQKINCELGIQYTTGMAHATETPVYNYIPFSYFAYTQIGYIF